MVAVHADQDARADRIGAGRGGAAAAGAVGADARGESGGRVCDPGRVEYGAGGRFSARAERLDARDRQGAVGLDEGAYELRKLAVSAALNAAGIEWAAALAGDNPETVRKYYAAMYRRQAPAVDPAAIIRQAVG